MKDKKLTILFPRIKQRRDHVNLAVPLVKAEVDLTNYVTEADLSDYVDDSITSLNIEQYAKVTSLDKKANKSEVAQIQDSKADKEDLKGLASEQYVQEKIDAIPEVDLSNYLTMPSAESTYAKNTDLNAYLTVEASKGLADKQYVDENLKDFSDAFGIVTEDLKYLEDRVEVLENVKEGTNE